MRAALPFLDDAVELGWGVGHADVVELQGAVGDGECAWEIGPIEQIGAGLGSEAGQVAGGNGAAAEIAGGQEERAIGLPDRVG